MCKVAVAPLHFFHFRDFDAVGLPKVVRAARLGEWTPGSKVISTSLESARLLPSQEHKRLDEPMLQVNPYSFEETNRHREKIDRLVGPATGANQE